MKDLIEALLIFIHYNDVDYPTHCEHDIMYIMGVDPKDVSAEDIVKLDKLGFFVSKEDGGGFISFKFGSA